MLVSGNALLPAPLGANTMEGVWPIDAELDRTVSYHETGGASVPGGCRCGAAYCMIGGPLVCPGRFVESRPH